MVVRSCPHDISINGVDSPVALAISTAPDYLSMFSTVFGKHKIVVHSDILISVGLANLESIHRNKQKEYYGGKQYWKQFSKSGAITIDESENAGLR